ncbi:winged helix-turn-helix domain-containing protein [Pseudolysobacter antarcticus]|uniref:Winged helix-turn-helix domain-containing protein n=1 Tax=Pseudolysobacter antarcticus TaxID=2511995 RepID=A0A411HJK2_9GAMM|nr:crosslink repair DNA glycosylase YcaQ family protein [Pseudolysobacter antarcticus]QBB70673.1 winged helix-turn-helix domain-containing protein [Pseudolysobacter antarcticus]
MDGRHLIAPKENRLPATDELETGKIDLSLQQARLLHLAAQGLLRRPRARATRSALLANIALMQLLQIDTINVVARSPYFVLFSRLGAYPNAWLDDALAGGEIFECWAHEACFAPVMDFPLHRHDPVARAGHWAMKHAQRSRAQDDAGMVALLDRIREHGPVKTADFERKQAADSSGWWSWKPEKRWLEAWFALGELMVLRRDKFQRVYDISERVIGRVAPEWKASILTREQIQQTLIAKAVQALGITQAGWIADYFRSGSKLKDVALQPLLDSGELLRISVTGWRSPAYVHRDNIELANQAARGGLRATHTTLLSPFDPLVWDRVRAREFFDFDYSLECYTPAPKRRYGYFVLPILQRGRLIGRLDAKAHRADGVFEVKVIHLEPTVIVDERVATDVALAIQSCADWHQTPQVSIGKSAPRVFASLLRSTLKNLSAV